LFYGNRYNQGAMMFKTIIHGLEDGSGPLLLPREMLDSLNLQVGDEFQIIETDDGLILEQFQEKCVAAFRPELRKNKDLERFGDSVKR
jgi:bifunctional DNA-binding transcriptional regulator/antitoxin component of YhaV-PrlF toxin-antitoxin module